MGVIYSCEKPNQPQPQPENKPAITIPTQSQAVFNNGISFSTPPSQQGSQPQPQTQTLTFTATESWSATVTDTKASSWLTVEPSSGGAGTVNMTVKAEPNDTDKARKATVTIKCGSTTKTFTVEQAAKPADPVEPSEPIAVTSISLNKKELMLSEGDSETLVATVKPDDATDKTVTWSSSDETVATVDKDGKVTAVKEGAAVITAKAGEKRATCDVTVNASAIPVSAVTLGKEELSLEVGTSFHSLYAVVSPVNATDKTVVWTNSDDTVIAICTEEDNPNGLVVTARKEGTSTITATAGGKSATCVVTVSPKTEISLLYSSLSLVEGESKTITVRTVPENAKVTWESSDENVATVDAGGTVTAKKEGSATITARNGEKYATCVVTVRRKFELNKYELTLAEGDSETLTTTIQYDDATGESVSWSSGSEITAIVDDNGKVTGVSFGNTIIYAILGYEVLRCAVTVVKKITLNKDIITLKEGESETLIATVYPDDAEDKTVAWSSSDKSVATVDASGKVTALLEGKARISATIGSRSAYCDVYVEEKGIESDDLEGFSNHETEW